MESDTDSFQSQLRRPLGCLKRALKPYFFLKISKILDSTILNDECGCGVIVDLKNREEAAMTFSILHLNKTIEFCHKMHNNYQLCPESIHRRTVSGCGFVYETLILPLRHCLDVRREEGPAPARITDPGRVEIKYEI